MQLLQKQLMQLLQKQLMQLLQKQLMQWLQEQSKAIAGQKPRFLSWNQYVGGSGGGQADQVGESEFVCCEMVVCKLMHLENYKILISS